MRTLCDVCEAAPARFFCAADEAALCTKCDEKVHGCNKLASRHVRLALAEGRAVPRCDICENAPAFFFCGIDGTSLCLQCDMDVHVGGKKTHERYLLMGQRVELPSKQLEEDLGMQPMTEQKRSHEPQQLQKCKLQEHVQERSENSNASAIAMAIGDADPPYLADRLASEMIDLNSRPRHLRGEPSCASQSVRDMELANSSDDEIAGVVPELSLKGKEPADS